MPVSQVRSCEAPGEAFLGGERREKRLCTASFGGLAVTELEHA